MKKKVELDRTTITVHRTTYESLRAAGQMGESFDALIRRLLKKTG